MAGCGLSPDRRALAAGHVSLARSLARPLARRHPAEAQDLRSAAQLGLVEAAGSFDPALGAPFRAFAVHRIRGAMLDHLRSVRPRRGVVRLTDDVPDARPVGADDGFEALIRPLPPRHAEVIRHLYARDHTQSEAARAMGYSRSRIGALHAEALDRLRGPDAGRAPRFARPSAAVHAGIRAMAAGGYPYATIAARYGWGRNSVSAFLIREGIARRPGRRRTTTCPP